MKAPASIADVQHAFLSVLAEDRLKHPNMLEATKPDVLWERATHDLSVTEEVGEMAINELALDRCLSRVNFDDGSHRLQISEEGLVRLKFLERDKSAAITAERREAKEDKRWRVGTLLSVGALIVAAMIFLAGYYAGQK